MAALEALLVTGHFGSGKTSVVEEIAEILEADGAPYAAIDLDWLTWANVPGADHDDHTLLVRNLVAMTAIYRDAGVRRFVLAGSVGSVDTLGALKGALGMQVRVVRLDVPLEVIEQRLGAVPTSGRADDLRRARDWHAEARGVGMEDAVVGNVGPIQESARRVLKVAGWV